MACVHDQIVFLGTVPTPLEGRKSPLHGTRRAGVSVHARVQLNSVTSGLGGGYDLFGLRHDKGTHEDPLLVHAPYNLSQAFTVLDTIEASFRRQLCALLRHERDLVRLDTFRNPSDGVCHGHFQIQLAGHRLFKEFDVTIITNSLAANNQASVHGGYAPSRKPLLKAGVRILEVRADAHVPGSEFVESSGAKTTLHTKAFVVDRREVFIGSFNFDPRSVNINTELGVIIRSPEIASEVADLFRADAGDQAFEPFLDEKGKLRWRGMENGRSVIFDKEPQTTWSQRFKAGFFRMLPIRSQL